MEENAIQINGGIIIKASVRVKGVIYVKEYYIWHPAACSCENRKYLAGIMDDSAITCDEVIESYNKETKTILKILLKRKQSVKRKISIFSLHFY